MEDNILIYSESLIELSESIETPDCLDIEFIICNFEPNLNGTQVDRDHIDEWINTLELKPIVGKIDKVAFKKNEDFTSHKAVKIKKKDKDGNEYEETILNTDAFGTFYEVGIKTIDDEEVIYAKGKIWKRFKKAVEILQRKIDNNEKISSSWEVNILNSEVLLIDGKEIKNILLGNFIGHCLLGYENGMKIQGAYGCSEVIEVAEKQDNNELEQAIIDDLKEINTTTELSVKSDDSDINKLNNEIEGGLHMSKQIKTEIASLTYRDISKGISTAIYNDENYGWDYNIVQILPLENKFYMHKYNAIDEDFIEVQYSIAEDGVVTIGEKTEVKMTFKPKTIVDTEIAELTIAKEKAETEVSTLKVSIETKDTEISELKETITSKETELSSKISSIVDLGKDITVKETVIAEKEELLQAKETEIAELLPFKAQIEELNAEKNALEIAEKKESFKNEYLSTKLISEKDLEIAEVKEAIETMDNGKMEIFIAQKVIANAKAGKPQAEIEVSEVKEPKVEVNLSSVGNGNKEFKFADCWK